MQGTPAATDVAGLSQRMTDFVTTVRQDKNEIYVRLDDAQDERLLMNGQLNMLRKDRRAHGRTARLMETEARLSREACLQSMDASDITRSKVRALRTTMLAQQTKIAGLRVADRTRQAQLVETLTLLRTLQTQVTELQSQQGPASGPAQPEIPEEADKAEMANDNIDSGTGVRKQALNLIVRCSLPRLHEMKNPILYGYLRSHRVDSVRSKTDKYCPRSEIKKLEVKMWNLKDVFPEESDKIEKYVGGLPDMIHGSVMASKPKTMQDAIEFSTELMDNKIRTFAERHSENKRKQDDNQQQQNKRQNTGRAYAAGSCEKKPYGGTFQEGVSKAEKQHRGNQGGNGNAPAKVYAVGRVGTNPDSNVVTGTFLLNNRYASVLFDTGADRSFVSTAFSSQIDITPSTLFIIYDVELSLT
ncbi:putative reverse transcriptase domain-containing protein [Tanacetum coccineum]